MPVIDIHTHIYPDAIAPRAIENVTKNGVLHAYSDGTAAGLRAAMQRARIDAAINLPLALNPESQRGVNTFAAALNAAPEPIYSLGSLHPDTPDPYAFLSWVKSLGLPGIKLHPEYQNFTPLEPRMMRIYQACSDLKLFILFHAGDDLAFSGNPRSQPADFARISDRFPDLTMLLAHLGGVEFSDSAAQNLAGRANVYFDVAYIAGVVPDDKMTTLINLYGTDRVMYGSDSPFRDCADHRAAFEKLPLTPAQFDAIFYKNALRFFAAFNFNISLEHEGV